MGENHHRFEHPRVRKHGAWARNTNVAASERHAGVGRGLGEQRGAVPTARSKVERRVVGRPDLFAKRGARSDDLAIENVTPTLYSIDSYDGSSERTPLDGALQRREGSESSFARDDVLDDRLRIGLSERDPGAPKLTRRRAPRTVEHLVRELRELGHEAANVVALRIELFTLCNGIEDAEIRGRISA